MVGTCATHGAARALAQTLPATSATLMLLARRSGELAAAERLAAGGARPDDVRFVDPVLMRLAAAASAAPARPWWRFW